MGKHVHTIIAASLALGTIGASAPALADDPYDPAMQTREARERDRQQVRQLNLNQLRYVQQRDAEYARGWEARREHQAAVSEYERRMAEWREAVRRCEAGDYRYCRR